MYEIRELTGQEYVDEYATKKARDAPGRDRGHVADRSRRRPTATAATPRRSRSAPTSLAPPAPDVGRTPPVVGQARGRPGTGSRAPMADEITITLPDGSTRALPAGHHRGRPGRGHRLPAGQGGGDRRRQRRPSATSRRPLADGDEVADRHGGQRPRASSRSATPRPTCWPRPCSTCSRGPRSPSARRSRTASTTTSSCPDGGARSSEDDLERHRGPHARDHRRAASRSSATSSRADEALRAVRRPPYKLEIIERRRPTTRCRPRRRRGPHLRDRRPVSVYRNGDPSFIDLCRGPHVPDTEPPRPLQADAGRRRLLARRREEPDAAAHLRHGVGDARPPRRAPPPARGGREARPPQARRRARPASASPTSSAPASPCGTRRAASSAGSWRTTAASATSRAATSSSTRRTSPRRRCSRRRGHLDWYADGMYPPMEMDNGDVLPEADELPVATS